MVAKINPAGNFDDRVGIRDIVFERNFTQPDPIAASGRTHPSVAIEIIVAGKLDIARNHRLAENKALP